MSTQHKGRLILQFIKDAKWEGRTFTEIQRFICEYNGLNYDEFKRDKWDNNRRRRVYRGYYCTNLQYLLPAHCWRNSDTGRWSLRGGPIPRHPYSNMAKRLADSQSALRYNKVWYQKKINELKEEISRRESQALARLARFHREERNRNGLT